jgi:hypothetical protein
MKAIDTVNTKSLKIITLICSLGFLLSVFKVSSLILLSFTVLFAYFLAKRLAEDVMKKGIKHYMPKKWKNKMGDKTIVEFLCDRNLI